MKKYLQSVLLHLLDFKSYLWLDRFSGLCFVTAVLLNALLWVFWRESRIGVNAIYLASGIILVNLFLALFSAQRVTFASRLLAGTALAVQILVLIYLKYFLAIFY